MKLISSTSLSITKKVVVNDSLENKIYYFEPGLVVDVPEEVAQKILDNPFNKQFISVYDEPILKEVLPEEEVKTEEKEIPVLKVIQDPPLPEEKKGRRQTAFYRRGFA